MISIFIVYEKLQVSEVSDVMPDGRIPPAPGTNQIAGFVEYRPFAHREKNNGYFCAFQ